MPATQGACSPLCSDLDAKGHVGCTGRREHGRSAFFNVDGGRKRVPRRCGNHATHGVRCRTAAAVLCTDQLRRL